MNKNDIIEYINYLVKQLNFYYYDTRKQHKIRELIHAYEHKLNLMQEV